MSRERAATILHSRTATAHRRNSTISVLPTFRTASTLQGQPRVTAPGHPTVTATAHPHSRSRHNSAQRALGESHHYILFTIGVIRALVYLFIPSTSQKRYQASADTFHSQQEKFGFYVTCSRIRHGHGLTTSIEGFLCEENPRR